MRARTFPQKEQCHLSSLAVSSHANLCPCAEARLLLEMPRKHHRPHKCPAAGCGLRFRFVSEAQKCLSGHRTLKKLLSDGHSCPTCPRVPELWKKGSLCTVRGSLLSPCHSGTPKHSPAGPRTRHTANCARRYESARYEANHYMYPPTSASLPAQREVVF